MSKLRENLGKLAAFAVAVLLIVIGLTVNLDRIKSWIAGPEISVVSISRGSVEEVFSNEPIRLTLKDVQATNVFWIFDEKEPTVGGVDFQHSFAYDESAQQAEKRDHRIDAFFKDGDSYKVAQTLVSVRNLDYEMVVSFADEGLIIKSPDSFLTDWVLQAASVADFVDGTFETKISLDLDEDGEEATGVVPNEVLRNALGLEHEIDLESAFSTGRRAYIAYEFRNPTGQKLTLVKAMSGENTTI